MPYKDPEKQKQAQRDSYVRTRDDRANRQKGRRKEWLDEIQRIKSVPCADCGSRFAPYVMEFDHLPQFEKKFGLANLALASSWEVILEEIAKCEIVCANCHRVRTHIRGGSSMAE